jgi:hypothetical protein
MESNFFKLMELPCINNGESFIHSFNNEANPVQLSL